MPHAESSSKKMDAIAVANRVIETEQPFIETNESPIIPRTSQIPHISEARRQETIHDEAIPLEAVQRFAKQTADKQKTFLYLAYGSNLCASTFRGKRNIKPLSQLNVVVPAIVLTFDLIGIPYSEPCFGNCKYRETNTNSEDDASTQDYHKDRWKKGLVGVVYEVTAEDYAHIIATEGGGAGYKDVMVDCYPLDDNPNAEVPLIPTSVAFRAHTLFAPSGSRADPAYAQPSPRYKKLITDGAKEHNLPHEYREYLDAIRPYEITTIRQKLGKLTMMATWGILFGLLFQGGLKMFLRKDGTYPAWVGKLFRFVFTACWKSYDVFFYPLFGDGERTIGEDNERTTREVVPIPDEKTPLISVQRQSMQE